MKIQHSELEDIATKLLLAVGENPTRPGLADTPKRFAKWWIEFMEYDPGSVDTVFETVSTDQMVVVTGIRVWSICEHHLLPFFCDISIGYLATDNVLGLSKFARITHKHAHKLQIQERLVQEIANEIKEITGTDDVAVVSKGVHLCMIMRGIKTPGQLNTSILSGRFREYSKVREEFFQLLAQPMSGF